MTTVNFTEQTRQMETKLTKNFKLIKCKLNATIGNFNHYGPNNFQKLDEFVSKPL